MTDQEIIEVVTAHKEGKQIQRQFLHWTLTSVKPEPMPWVDCVDGEGYDTMHYNYRVKPEPRKPREWNCILGQEGGISSVWFGKDYKTIRVREVLE